MVLIKKEVKEIYYGTGVDVWDTQGPAPDGYHVPTTDEWKAVYNALVALGQNGDGIRIKLKMPFTGRRSFSSSNVESQGSQGFYWSSSPSSGTYSTYSANYFSFISSTIYPSSSGVRAYGKSVRCFRNYPLKPSSSWTTIYAGSNGAGIFHNPSEGVISISSDGQTWITIADKNLGATTIYNDGDTLNQANCGYYYQWGNNYGFAWTGTVTTSSTAVDASSYGPGNYYSSSTFITSSSTGDWSSVLNNNLRGGVTQGVTSGTKKVKAVYYGSTKIRPASRLPSAYQEVAWIGTTGTQWINTGLSPTGIQTETKIELTTTAQDTTIFGCYTPGFNSASQFYHLTPYNSRWYFGKSYSEGNGGTYTATVGKQYVIVYNNSDNYLNVDGTNVVSVSGTVGYLSQPLAISLRGNTNSRGDNRYGQYKYFYFKMYNKSTSKYVRDFVPCYRKSDNVIGMYDLVGNQFYTNSGSGTFTKGANVN